MKELLELLLEPPSRGTPPWVELWSEEYGVSARARMMSDVAAASVSGGECFHRSSGDRKALLTWSVDGPCKLPISLRRRALVNQLAI